MEELAQSCVYDPERLMAMGREERQRRVEAGFIDDLEDQMPYDPPPFESLVNRCVCV